MRAVRTIDLMLNIAIVFPFLYSPFDGFLEGCLEPSEDTDKLLPLTKMLEYYNIYLAKLYPQKHKISIRKLSSELETRGYEFHTPSTKNERSEHGYRKCLKGYYLDLYQIGLNMYVF